MSIKYQVSSIKYQVSSIKYQVSSIKYQVIKIIFLLIMSCNINSFSQTASFTADQLYKIQNTNGYAELGSANVPVMMYYYDPISGTLVPSGYAVPIGPLPFYQFRTNKFGYSFDKNIVSQTGKYTSGTNELSLNFLTTPFGSTTPVLSPAVLISKTNGKVGIGHTSALTMLAKLDVKVTNNLEGLRVSTTHTSDWLSNTWLIVNRNNTQAFKISNNNYSGLGAFKDVFKVMGDGNTSIGDPSLFTSTWSKLNVYASKYQAGLNVSTTSDNPNMECIVANVNNGYHKAFVVKLNGTENFKVNGSGDFCARGGKITAGPFPDFVFENDYIRMNYLQKTNYLKVNKHLPYMPSAKEVAADGLDLGTSILGITQNVEENTLDILDIYKALELLKIENEKLKLEILKLQNEKK